MLSEMQEWQGGACEQAIVFRHAVTRGLTERKIRAMLALFRPLSNIVFATALLSIADLAAAQSSSSAPTRAVTPCAELIKVAGQRFPNTTTVITSAQVNAASDAKPGNPAAGPAGAAARRISRMKRTAPLWHNVCSG